VIWFVFDRTSIQEMRVAGGPGKAPNRSPEAPSRCNSP
jgi:hypothetical protein